MKTYLCGGIAGLNDAQCKGWREEAKLRLVTETLDPMDRDYRVKVPASYLDVVEPDLDDIGNSDFLLVNATKPSWGTAMEIVHAFLKHKHVVAFVGEDSKVSPWLEYHCNRVYVYMEDAIHHINFHAKIDGK